MSEFTGERLQAALAPRAIHYYQQTGSTNDHAMAWLEEGAPVGGSIVITDEQSHGRGRLGRLWYAPMGTALTFSYILRPPANMLTYVGMMGALVVCELAETLGIKAGIKWPNDVHVDGRKLCGVLPEACWRGAELRGAVLGIGINVRVDFSDTEFADTAISLETAAGSVDRLVLLEHLLERLDYWSLRLNSEALYKGWRSRLAMLGRRVSIQRVDGLVEGIAEAVDRNGALLIRSENGVLHRMIAGDIALG